MQKLYSVITGTKVRDFLTCHAHAENYGRSSAVIYVALPEHNEVRSPARLHVKGNLK